VTALKWAVTGWHDNDIAFTVSEYLSFHVTRIVKVAFNEAYYESHNSMESNRYKFQKSDAMRDVLENRCVKTEASSKNSFATSIGFFRRNIIDYPN
jgi:hypothetical protein